MADRSEGVEDQAVQDASAVYSVESEIAASEEVPFGYKRTEVGVIPKDWQARKIGALAQIKRGASPRPIADSKWFDTKSEIGWLRISDVAREGKFIRATDQSLSDAGVARSRLVRPGNVVMSMAATVGRPAINRKTVCIHDGFVVFEKPTVTSEFLYYLFLAIEDRWAERGQTGSQVNLNTHIIGTTPVPLPTTEAEQRAIATALSDADALIESLDRLIAKKRAIKQAAMQQLLTGQTRLPGFTGEWETKRLGDVASFHKGSGLSKADLLADGSDPCIHYGELFTRYGERITSVRNRTDRKAACFRSFENDVLMPTSDVTPNGLATASCIEESNVILGGDILIIRPNGAEIDGTFLAYKIRMDHRQIMQLVSGTTVFHIYGRDMAEFTYKAPTTEEQQAIVSVLSDMDTEIEALEHRREKARQIKQGMMQQLLTGRVRLIEENREDAWHD